MPSDPEKNMDELLKAYAQKRREQAGAPFELHPATRNLFQAEVARQASKPRGEEAAHWWSRLSAHWLRFAMVTSAAAVVFVGVLIWNDSRSSQKAESQLALAHAPSPSSGPSVSDESPVGQVAQLTSGPREKDRSESDQRSPAQPPATALSLSAPFRLSEKVEDGGESPPAGPKSSPSHVETLARSSTPLPSRDQGPPAESDSVSLAAEKLAKAEPVPQLAQPSEVRLRQEEERQKLASGSARSFVESTSAQAPHQQALFYLQNTASRQRFAQVTATTEPEQIARPAAVPAILNSFQLDQTGNSLRITEEDGSTYQGEILESPIAKEPTIGKPITTLRTTLPRVQTAPSTSQSRRSVRSDPKVAPKETLPLQNVQFRAVGTNQSLKQQVVINGNILLNTNDSGYAKFLSEGQGALMNNQQAGGFGGGFGAVLNQVQLPASRIQGKAIVGGNKEIEINAVPTARP